MQRFGATAAVLALAAGQLAAPAWAQYAPPPPDGYAPPPPSAGTPPPPDPGYAPPPPGPGTPRPPSPPFNTRPPNNGYAPPPPPPFNARPPNNGYAPPPPLPGMRPPYPQVGGGFAGRVRCESIGYRFQRCGAATRGRVVLARELAGGCRQGQNWGFDYGSIWVTAGCRADFAYGYGREGLSGGPNAGAVIGGAAVAAGLIALLSRSGRRPVVQSAPPARLVGADFARLPYGERRTAELCFGQAALQVGETGGRELRVGRLLDVAPRRGGFALVATAVAGYPDGGRALTLSCRTENDRIAELDFR